MDAPCNDNRPGLPARLVPIVGLVLASGRVVITDPTWRRTRSPPRLVDSAGGRA